MENSGSNWQNQFQKRFQEASARSHLRRDVIYLVGVSGGADSVALAHWLHSQHFRIVIGHFHHGARQTADDDAAFVKAFANDHEVPFHEGYADVPAMAKENGWSFEEAARIVRYQFLFATAEMVACGGVVVAHTADDQVETVLMHLLRGAGAAGMTGMRFCELMPVWHLTIPLLRPFLNQWREDVERYCRQHKLVYVNDESNLDQSFFRNRLRHSLIPQLAAYNAGVKEHIWQTADILKDSENIVMEAVDKGWERVVITEKEGLAVLDCEEFVLSEPALQRYILRRCVAHLYPALRDFSYVMTRSITALIAEQDHEGCWPLFEDSLLVRYQTTLLLGKEEVVYRYLCEDFCQWCHPARLLDSQTKETLNLGNGWALTYEEYPMSDRLSKASPWLDENPLEVWFDVDQLALPILLRHAEEGDRFQPFGMNGRHMKLSDYFVNHKIPQMMRGFFPLVCDAEDILWVVGKRRSEKGLITPSTSQVIHFRLMYAP